MSKWDTWYDALPEHTKQSLSKQPIWHDVDLIKAAVIGAVIGFLLGFVVGYDVAFEPVVTTFKPLIG